MTLYTKNGRPLQQSGDMIYSRSGAVVGRISGSKVYGPNGRYVGSLVGDRLLYRSTESAGIGSSFSASSRCGSASASAVASAAWGDEPNIPD
jgi:hypothetical protein